MKQKKKSSPAISQTNVTILDFFQARPAESHKRKSKTVADKREIIVIGSDSDSEDSGPVQVVAFSKRRKFAEKTPSKYAPSTSTLEVEDTIAVEEWRHLEVALPNSNTPSSRMSFGDPALLQENYVSPSAELAAASSSLTFAPEAPQLSRKSSNEGAPYALLAKHGSNSCSKAPASEVDIDLTLDSWDTWDDEYQSMGIAPDDDIPMDIPEPLRDAQPVLKPSNAFSVLMSGHKENEVWKEADVAEDRGFRANKYNGNRRKAPFYKVLQGMPIAVDAFKYGSIPQVNAYFLTHAHSDHYTNLSSTWKSGPIYCSKGTANLIIHMLSVDKKWVHPLPMDVPTIIPNTGGVQVTLIEANHCPGSSLFFFEGLQTVNAGDTNFKSAHVGSSRVFRYLHCGDFRASPQHVLHPAVQSKVIDQVYLDTTYLDPKYTFPPQALVTSACADLATKLASGAPNNGKRSGVFSWLNPIAQDPPKNQAKDPNKPVLFVIGTYSIGKERIVKAVANALNSKVYCDKRKADILRCQADPELDSLLTSNPADSVVHLLPLGMITSDRLPAYLDKFKSKYSKVIGFRPTGWTYVQPSGTEQLPTVNTILTRTVQKPFTFEDLKPSAKSTSTLQIYPVPYSEHSSFYELTCFAVSLNWGKIIATVNVGSEKSRGKMAKWFSKWEAERKKRGQVDVVAHRHLDYW